MISERADATVDGKIEGRTAWAYTAVTAFARFTGQVEGGDVGSDIGRAISSLICELHRLADAEGLDWVELVIRGNRDANDALTRRVPDRAPPISVKRNGRATPAAGAYETAVNTPLDE